MPRPAKNTDPAPLSPDGDAALFARLAGMIQQLQMDDALALLDTLPEETQADERALVARGAALFMLNRIDDAIAPFEKVLAVNPGNIDALNNLGSCMIRTGRFEDALAYLQKAYAIAPNDSIRQNMASIHNRLGRYDQSLALLEEMIAGNPANVECRLQAINILHLQGKHELVMQRYHDLVLNFAADPLALRSFTTQMANYRYIQTAPSGRTVLLTCLRREDITHQNLCGLWASFIMNDEFFAPLKKLAAPSANPLKPAAIDALTPVLADDLLCLGLARFINVDTRIETALTTVRRAFLDGMMAAGQWPSTLFRFLSALAINSWINEYAFLQTEAEKTAIDRLEETLRKTAQAGIIKPRDHMLFALYACYRPLTTLKLTRAESDILRAQNTLFAQLVRVQIDEPRIEDELKSTIDSFVPITDETSGKVRAQYEERPYPRWISVGEYALSPELSAATRSLEILCAGCGTGQEAIHMAKGFPQARVTAVDLSFSSLAYAKRKAIEMGMADRITFLQGDLMEVAKIGRKFDVVASSGVLHHLKDPLKGLKALQGVMKPDFRFFMCLYSKIARDHTLSAASDFIAQNGYTATPDGIRAFRRDLMQTKPDHPARICTNFRDFYSLSECCDLLFHVQEHRFTLPQIKTILAENGLDVHTFRTYPEQLAGMRRLFGQDASSTDLDLWHRYEEQNPDAFMCMYRFWLKPAGGREIYPVDSVIREGGL